MATTIKSLFDTNGQTITCTLASLTTGSRRQSTVIDNSSNLYTDILLMLKVKTGGSSTSATGYVEVFVYGTVDGGTTYSDTATGTDGAVTLTLPVNVILVDVVNTVANSTTYIGGPWNLRNAFGGYIPQKWGVVIGNQSGGTLDGTEGSHAKLYQGGWLQVV